MNLRVSRYPVTVALGDGRTLEHARILIVGDTLYAYTAPTEPGETVELAVGAKVRGAGNAVIDAADGTVVAWTTEGGCGCGDPLKNIQARKLLAMNGVSR